MLLWPWSRMTGFRRVQEVIAAAGIWGIELNMVQKWLGNAQLTTAAIYANADGEEEQSIAARMW